jgi:hypothetical protein
MRQLLAPLLDEPRSPADWVDALTDILVALYADQVLDAREAGARATLLACEQLHAALDALRDVPARLAPSASATTAILMLLGLIEQTDVPAVESDHAIELLGWLELPLDDAPALIVTGFCDGVVPQSVNADLFLPNRLRSSLGIDDNRRRYARDAYALQVLLNSRQYLRLIVPRRDAQGDPLRPSRLLFATDQESIVGRCLRFFDPGGMADARPVVRPAARAASTFCVPRPLPLAEPFDRLRVTDFRYYLECPYRFYLQRVLGLRQVTDDADEIDAAAFARARVPRPCPGRAAPVSDR